MTRGGVICRIVVRGRAKYLPGSDEEPYVTVLSGPPEIGDLIRLAGGRPAVRVEGIRIDATGMFLVQARIDRDESA